MTLDQKHKAEKVRLQSLLDGLESRATNWVTLNDVVGAYVGFGYGDPTEHFKAALKHYIEDV
ncbi:hypothetical protein [Methylobacter sp.]|uniref:hypothetical protein n=1 Tax=Methylobacter sp. TaxID=2051955 RepID=UPI002FDC7B01